MTIPCGQCVGCRLERARQWAVRCMHEASLHESNAFITLTYDDAHVPDGASLDREAFPKFMKRLRKRFEPQKVRYFHAGEYGSVSRRPHYHACLFGFDFPDKVEWTVRGGHQVWRSEVLEALWPDGLSEVGSVTFESAAYVARYVVKKVQGDEAEEHYQSVDPETGEVFKIEPEYTTMSRRPGIGAEWLKKYMCEVYPADGVVVGGQLRRPPRFYDGIFELNDPKGMRKVRHRRAVRVNPEDQTPERLAVREVVAQAGLNLKKRELQ